MKISLHVKIKDFHGAQKRSFWHAELRSSTTNQRFVCAL